jgi:hypothetical protein
MLVSEITESQFRKFLELQESGVINMADSVRGANIINESRETYIAILMNYTELKSKWAPSLNS